jgi:hypothetical protein
MYAVPRLVLTKLLAAAYIQRGHAYTVGSLACLDPVFVHMPRRSLSDAPLSRF